MYYIISSFYSKTLFLLLILMFSNCAGSRASSQDDPFKESTLSASDASSQENLDSKKLYKTNDISKISVNDIVLKACGLALRDVPDVNVTFNEDHIRKYHK